MNIPLQSIACVLKSKAFALSLSLGMLSAANVFGQTSNSPRSVTEIITNYGGFWQSGSGAPAPSTGGIASVGINSIRPDNSHDLLAFVYQGKRFSTGVNNELLKEREIPFESAVYKSLPQFVISSAITSRNTKIALGQMYDRVHAGPSNPKPDNDVNKYLQDGKNGLDMGTGIANIPAGTLIFDMTNIDENTVGDGIPDIIVTQIADPSNSTDRYSFYDENNVRVGNEVPITFSSTNTSVPVIPSIGEWVGDFYDAIDMNLEGGSSNMTNGVRQLRMWAGDFVDFGITKANVSQVRKFQIRLSGNSDIAFVAYNENSFVNRSPIPMPVTLTKFQAKQHKGQVSLLWETASELNSSHFEVEVSENGRTFTKVGSVPAAGNTTLKQQYSFRQSLQRDGIYYYRLRQVDLDGTFEYSKTITVASNASNRTVSLYPNPTADDVVRLSHPMALGSEKITLIDLAGKHVLEQAVEQGSVETPLRISSLAKGIYQVVWRSAEGTEVRKLLRK